MRPCMARPLLGDAHLDEVLLVEVLTPMRLCKSRPGMTKPCSTKRSVTRPCSAKLSRQWPPPRRRSAWRGTAEAVPDEAQHGKALLVEAPTDEALVGETLHNETVLQDEALHGEALFVEALRDEALLVEALHVDEAPSAR